MVAAFPLHRLRRSRRQAITVRWFARRRLALVCVAGLADEATIAAAMTRAQTEGALPVGADRLVLVARDARLHRLDLKALRAIKALVLEMESADGRMPAHRCALVCDDPLRRPLAELYRMLWSAPRVGETDYRVLDRVCDARAWFAARTADAGGLAGLDVAR